MIIDENLIKEPKISIIITYYNLGKYIQDCVASILNQEYKNFEIIIVNDNSNEENFKILKEFKDEKIKIINLQKNSGQLIAFCEGLKIANGEFVSMVDADDILLPNYLKTLLYVHLNHNYALISCAGGEIDSKNEITSYKINSKNKIEYKELEKIFNNKEYFEIQQIKAPFGLWSWNPSTSGMFRKSALEILHLYPNKEYWKTGADKVLFSLLHLVGGSACITNIGYLYRHHGLNNSQTSLIVGDKKYLNENYIKKLIAWNKKLRFDTLKMFIENKKELTENKNKLF